METKTYDGQTGKFLAKVAENMPKISAEIMQKWIENPIDLQKALSDALLPSQKFEIWKTIRIGGFRNADEISKAIKKSGMKIGDYTNDILGKIPLATSETDINVVLLSVAELGFKDGAEYGKICSRAKELGLELCPAEIGPQLRLQYKDQSNGEWIIVAMEPITGSDGDLRLFHVGRYGNDLWLSSYYGRSDYFWSSGYRFVFSLPQVK
ncbi:MAG: hypothetical protein PHD31_01970 [Candidatus Pacebacteria bacterium]|nr:hypothetical protein [Candidatus Paceibacterota bacterium]